MSELKCAIQFDENLWRDLNSEMDESGEIIIGDNNNKVNIQVMPISQYQFIPGFEKEIKVIVDFASQIALGLFVNWLYDKLKSIKADKVKINSKIIKIEGKDALKKAIDENEGG